VFIGIVHRLVAVLSVAAAVVSGIALFTAPKWELLAAFLAALAVAFEFIILKGRQSKS
jgi:hypothetical protein